METVIDCDLHNVVPSSKTLFPYLSAYWQEQMSQTGFGGPADNYYPGSAAISARPEAKPASGGPAGSDLTLLREQALDPWATEYGILNCAYALDGIHNPDAAAALARAVNDWQIAEWLDPEPRLRASIVVPIQHPEMAADEIDRVGGHPNFVQVFLPVRSAAPYGNRRFHPVYEAALRQDLAIGIHAGGVPGNAPTPVGWPTFYIEEYAGMASVFQSQLLSLVCEGVFDQFPLLRVSLLESGCTWLPSLMWRFDKEWKGLRREVPWVRRPPSEYIREHVRMTLQPFDAPPTAGQILQIVDQMGSEEMLMFSTDYPHWHFNSKDDALPAGLPETLRRKILRENALSFYRLGGDRK